MNVWHCIIPFYYGENEYVLVKGGAPVRRKVSYLSQTVASIQRLPVRSRITVFVCNEASEQRALEVHPAVRQIDCPPGHLPLVGNLLQCVVRCLDIVQRYQREFSGNSPREDFLHFTRDTPACQRIPASSQGRRVTWRRSVLFDRSASNGRMPQDHDV